MTDRRRDGATLEAVNAAEKPVPAVAPSRARSFVLALHRRLLPPDEEVGWVPYLWLVYLVAVVLPPFASPASLWQRIATLGGVAVFLVLYFVGYHVSGRGAVAVIGAITGLGVAFLPWNGGGVSFFIYAGAFCGRVGRMREGLRVLAAVLGALGLCSLTTHGASGWTFAFIAVVTALVGLVNLYYAELSRKRRALRVSEEEVKRLAATAERERIGRDLHDLLGHTLSVIALKSELASRLVDRSPERAAVEIRDVERISREALAEVRAAVAGYRAASLPVEVTNARLALRAADVRFDATVDGPALPPQIDAVLAMVLREAVTNVVRHANATRCEASVHAGDASVVLRVTDDGRGGPFRERSGVAGMRERVTERGGTLEIRSESGTHVVVTLPLGGPASLSAAKETA